ncbi:MAG: acyl-homoserine lactone acylase PvdQ, partial [Myxococcota bacterium]
MTHRSVLQTQFYSRPLVAVYGLLALFALCACDTEDTTDTSGQIDDTQTTLPDTVGGEDATDGADVSSDVDMPVDGDVGEPPLSDDQKALLAIAETESWTLAGLSAPVHVVRTEANVPHVYAKNREDLGRVLGFTLARDRYFVMDLQRRLGRGTITQLLGDAALENDLEARWTGVTWVGAQLEANLDDDLRAYLTAFADGVNEYIDAVRAGTLEAPSELKLAFALVGAPDAVSLMDDFEVADITAMAAVVMYQTNFETGDVGRTAARQALATIYDGHPDEEARRAAFTTDIWDNARPIFPGSGSTTGFGQTGAGKPGDPAAGAALQPKHTELPTDMLQRLADRLDHFSKKINRDQVAGFGSNAWAVAASKSANAGTLVAGDGHLQLSVPALMYQVGLDTSVFGGGDTHQLGLFLTPLPIMGAGTNGKVAWSMVNPVVDITDWYREELQLDESGKPAATKFNDEWQSLSSVEETFVIANVPALGSVGRTETWTRYTTFDGRWIMEMEGVEVASKDEAADPSTVVNVGGKLVVPGDTNGDDIISAISFDYGAFDATQWTSALADMGFSDDVGEFQEATKKLVGGGLFSAVGDDKGNILYSSYQAVPCRGYLAKTDGVFGESSDPSFLLDGNVYGAFSMPSTADGKVDEGPGQSDPYKCVVPFDAMPQAVNPDNGFVVTANNDPADITDDGDINNDEYYIGGPWSSVRANTISREIENVIAKDDATVETMSEIQGSKASRLGEEFGPLINEAITAAAALATTDGPKEPWEERLAALYTANEERFNSVHGRINEWNSLGSQALSGVKTFYSPAPEPFELDSSVATMIFNAWFPRFISSVWNDEPVGGAFPYSSSRMKVGALRRFLAGRGANNPLGHASWAAETEESFFFDVNGTSEVERSQEIALTALVAALDFLESDPNGDGT